MIYDILTTPQGHQFDPSVNILLVSCSPHIFSQAYGDITSGQASKYLKIGTCPASQKNIGIYGENEFS